MNDYTAPGATPQPDYAKAFNLYTLACKDDDAEACHSLAQMHTKQLLPDLDPERGVVLQAKAIRIWTQNCDMRHGRSCRRLADMTRDGFGVRRDIKRAEELGQQACDYDKRWCDQP